MYQGSTLTESFAHITSALASELSVDRIGLLHRRSGGWKLIATSTQPRVDHRTRQVRLLERLVTLAMNDKHSITFELGVTSDDALEPSDELDAYLDESGSRELHIEAIANDDASPANAVIVLERFRRPDEITMPIADALDPVRHLLAVALHQAIERHDRTLTSLIGQWLLNRWTSPSLRRSLITMCVLSALTIGMLCVPVALTIPVAGRVVPRNERHVFAPADGQVSEVVVSDNELVKAGQVLLVIHSDELSRLRLTSEGDLSTAEARLNSLLASRSADRNRMSEVEEQTLRSEVDGLRSEIELLSTQREQLTLRSPIAGRIDRWDLEQSLTGRPLARGQFLFDIVSIGDGFDVELEIPDQHLGDVLALRLPASVTVACTLRLRSNPDPTYHGVMDRVNASAHRTATGQSVVTAHVALENYRDEHLRSGATVIARLHCGRAAAGYVLFRGVIQWWRGLTW